ncbi:MAG TPA: thioredoxin domain-containing protein [Sphingomonas sp.]|uniref:thioredoxin domain-containing protein n=1 Tax=Sphingomonas sp. TaxID=28214 RepID=UPI002ED9245A
MMRYVAAVMAVTLAAAGGAQAAPARAVDWTKTIATTPAGAYVMGNPRAKVKLVEYLSLSCSHCAAFAAEGLPTLKRAYIARGLVSLEVRNAVRDGFDFAGVMLSRCAGPAGYFPASEQILATQPVWMPKAQAFFEAQQGLPQPGSEAEAVRRMATAAGFDQMMQARGLTPARVTACMADPKQTAIVTAMTAEAFNTRKIPGTPTFLINGVMAPETATWATLQPKLAAALR